MVGGIQTATVILLSLTEQLSYSAMIIVTDFRISTLAVSVYIRGSTRPYNKRSHASHMLVTCLSCASHMLAHACRVLVTCISCASQMLVRCWSWSQETHAAFLNSIPTLGYVVQPLQHIRRDLNDGERNVTEAIIIYSFTTNGKARNKAEHNDV